MPTYYEYGYRPRYSRWLVSQNESRFRSRQPSRRSYERNGWIVEDLPRSPPPRALSPPPEWDRHIHKNLRRFHSSDDESTPPSSPPLSSPTDSEIRVGSSMGTRMDLDSLSESASDSGWDSPQTPPRSRLTRLHERTPSPSISPTSRSRPIARVWSPERPRRPYAPVASSSTRSPPIVVLSSDDRTPRSSRVRQRDEAVVVDSASAASSSNRSSIRVPLRQLNTPIVVQLFEERANPQSKASTSRGSSREEMSGCGGRSEDRFNLVKEWPNSSAVEAWQTYRMEKMAISYDSKRRGLAKDEGSSTILPSDLGQINLVEGDSKFPIRPSRHDPRHQNSYDADSERESEDGSDVGDEEERTFLSSQRSESDIISMHAMSSASSASSPNSSFAAMMRDIHDDSEHVIWSEASEHSCSDDPDSEQSGDIPGDRCDDSELTYDSEDQYLGTDEDEPDGWTDEDDITDLDFEDERPTNPLDEHDRIPVCQRNRPTETSIDLDVHGKVQCCICWDDIVTGQVPESSALHGQFLSCGAHSICCACLASHILARMHQGVEPACPLCVHKLRPDEVQCLGQRARERFTTFWKDLRQRTNRDQLDRMR